MSSITSLTKQLRIPVGERRRWIDEEHFGQLIGLCQFLPGPASSQLGFSLGLLRAGWLGALAAFIGFTMPSALLLYALAASSNYLAGAWGEALVHGLRLVAVAVVAQGILGMARTLTPDAPRALMARHRRSHRGGRPVVDATPRDRRRRGPGSLALSRGDCPSEREFHAALRAPDRHGITGPVWGVADHRIDACI